MSGRGPTRNLWGIVLSNFLKSFQPRQIRGDYIGEDYFGNKYYEIPPDPKIGKHKPTRWFDPADKDADQELTAEWDSWLRGRRAEPPTREELIQNLQIMDMKKRNAALLDQTYAKTDADGKKLEKPRETIGTFPKYDEYELVPGKKPGNQKH